MTSVASYYDGFRERLLEDYRFGNPRVTAALAFARESLSEAQSILDVGCGIGWSSAELTWAGAEVHGIDISPVLIGTARETFGHICTFQVADFATAEIDGNFDAVVMIDSYEHFPRERRPDIHAQVDGLLGERLLLTVPTLKTMQYARDHGIPLQIVDEDVTDEDVERLAADVGGSVIENRVVSIYRADDYRHVLICRT